jgi:penicillin-binding protein 1A
MMNGMMRQTLLIGTAKKADLPGWPAAGKTGTSQDFRDAWFIGYTSHLVTGVWLGNDDSSPTKKATGSGLPVEIWSRFMKVAHQNQQIADLPGLRSSPGWFGAASGPAAAAAPPVDRQAPVDRLGPVPVASAGSNVRPQADHGLDGWFLERLFGRR